MENLPPSVDFESGAYRGLDDSYAHSEDKRPVGDYVQAAICDILWCLMGGEAGDGGWGRVGPFGVIPRGAASPACTRGEVVPKKITHCRGKASVPW